MVIKDEKERVVILLDKDDILNYIFEKCEFEVGIVVKDMVEKEEDANDKDLEWYLKDSQEENIRLNNERDDLERRNEDLEENNATLERINEKLKESLQTTIKAYNALKKQCKIQKDIYVEYLKSQGLEFAAKKLKEFDE